MTPAALRARRPYFVKNMITALGLFALTGGIYLYTFKSIQRDDDFSDVPVPPISDENLDKLKREYEQEKK